MKLQLIIPALITAAFLSTTFGSVSHAEVVSTGTETPLQIGTRLCQKAAEMKPRPRWVNAKLMKICKALQPSIDISEGGGCTFVRSNAPNHDGQNRVKLTALCATTPVFNANGAYQILQRNFAIEMEQSVVECHRAGECGYE